MSEFEKVLDTVEGLADTVERVLPPETDAEREMIEGARRELAIARKLVELTAQRDELLEAGRALYDALQTALGLDSDKEVPLAVAFKIVGAKESWNKAIAKAESL